MIRIETTTPIPHGVVFLYDPTAKIIDVPEDTGAGPVLATANCVSVWTTHDIEGSTNLVITDRFDGIGCRLVFEGSVLAQGGKLAFNDSSCDPLLQVQLSGSVANVAIWTDDADSPSKVVCVVSPLIS